MGPVACCFLDANMHIQTIVSSRERERERERERGDSSLFAAMLISGTMFFLCGYLIEN